jgi:hypothetical protein
VAAAADLNESAVAVRQSSEHETDDVCSREPELLMNAIASIRRCVLPVRAIPAAGHALDLSTSLCIS